LGNSSFKQAVKKAGTRNGERGAEGWGKGGSPPHGFQKKQIYSWSKIERFVPLLHLQFLSIVVPKKSRFIHGTLPSAPSAPQLSFVITVRLV